MIAIAVDDEALMLGALTSAIEVSPDIAEVARFPIVRRRWSMSEIKP